MQINDRLFLLLGSMMIVPTICILLNVDPGTATIATMGTNLAMLFYIRKTFKGITNGLFGNKVKFACLTCGGTKFDGKGTCFRCGGRSKKSV